MRRGFAEFSWEAQGRAGRSGESTAGELDRAHREGASLMLIKGSGGSTDAFAAAHRADVRVAILPKSSVPERLQRRLAGILGPHDAPMPLRSHGWAAHPDVRSPRWPGGGRHLGYKQWPRRLRNLAMTLLTCGPKGQYGPSVGTGRSLRTCRIDQGGIFGGNWCRVVWRILLTKGYGDPHRIPAPRFPDNSQLVSPVTEPRHGGAPCVAEIRWVRGACRGAAPRTDGPPHMRLPTPIADGPRHTQGAD
jgi:hypothetical protein